MHFQELDIVFLLSSSSQGLTKTWFLSQWEKVGVGPWMNYCIVQVQSGRSLCGSVCKVISQSPDVVYRRTDTSQAWHGGSALDEKNKNIIFTFTGSEEVHGWRPSVCWRSLERAVLPHMAANSTNGHVYDRAAQTQRVSIHWIFDKRRLDMLVVKPLIMESYILNRSFYLTCAQFEVGKII